MPTSITTTSVPTTPTQATLRIILAFSNIPRKQGCSNGVGSPSFSTNTNEKGYIKRKRAQVCRLLGKAHHQRHPCRLHRHFRPSCPHSLFASLYDNQEGSNSSPNSSRRHCHSIHRKGQSGFTTEPSFSKPWSRAAGHHWSQRIRRGGINMWNIYEGPRWDRIRAYERRVKRGPRRATS